MNLKKLFGIKDAQRFPPYDLKKHLEATINKIKPLLTEDEYTLEHLWWLGIDGGLNLYNMDAVAMQYLGFERIATWNRETNQPNPAIWKRKPQGTTEEAI